MSTTKPGEVELTARYKDHILRSSMNQAVGIENTSEHRLVQSQFDFHAEVKGPGGYEAASMVRRLIQDRADSFAYLLCDTANGSRIRGNRLEEPSQQEPTVILQQEGTFRTNCLDCLDRTNLIQTIISQMAIELFLGHRSERATADFWMRHSSLWADNGDALSKIYAGTGALKSSFTRHGKMSLAGAIADARKSATRLYINNFADQGRQNTIDMLLGRLVEQKPVHLYDPINDYVTTELRERFGPRMLSVIDFRNLTSYSLQEFSTTESIHIWAGTFNTINTEMKGSSKDDYVLLRSGQLVGAALLVFVRSSALKKIKNVEGSVKKTGMSGIAGNKGAVAIRLDYADTRICLVTAHLAAGFANYEERNRDYRTISHGLRFQRNRSIDDHDTIIWLGDFNYRIGLSDDKVRRLIRANDLGTLYQNDQMIAGRVFPYYSEAQITFLPTYKYDNGTDEYDTSEKARIPAWCDRILRKGNNLKQIEYTTASLRFSDHRPVYATFQCTISSIDEQQKEKLSRSLYDRRKRDIGGSDYSHGKTDEDLVGYNSIAEGLPPASSDRRKWWLDNALPVRSQVRAPQSNMVLNPARPPNPFSTTHEPDWVMIARTKGFGEAERKSPTAPAPPTRLRERRLPLSPSGHPGESGSALDMITAVEYGTSKTPPSPSSASTDPSIGRKPAPPVPRKPALLSTPSTTPNKSLRNNSNSGTHTPAPAPPPRRDTSASITPNAQSSIAHGSPLNAKPRSNGPRPSSASQPPPSPLRRGTSRSTARHDLLDEDIGDLGTTIPTLQPLRPG
ncbi:MAG: hypothetical protein LQ352_001864 [Teloschistes flavicans]|nr:MAG: hypothetical protein LQ352_001864 [Teloschistes flavicans]